MKFPEQLRDEDYETIVKEWQLAGLEIKQIRSVEFLANMLIITSNEGREAVYIRNPSGRGSWKKVGKSLAEIQIRRS
jgi:hypothetical protein